MRLDGMSEWKFGVQAISATPPEALDLDIATVLQISHDPLDGSFGDADSFGDLAKLDLGIARQNQQNVGVIAQKRPRRFSRTGFDRFGGDPNGAFAFRLGFGSFEVRLRRLRINMTRHLHYLPAALRYPKSRLRSVGIECE